MSTQAQTTIDATIAAAGSKATYAGAGTTAAGWLLSSEFAVLVGIALGLAGFLVNVWFKRREERHRREFYRQENARAQEFHAARLRWLERGGKPADDNST